MRYFVKKTSPTKKGLYLQIYRTNYVPGKGNQNRSYQSLGYASDLKKKGINDPMQYAKDLCANLNKENEKKTEMQIGEASAQKYLGHFLIKMLFNELNMDKDINTVSSGYKSHFKMSDFIKTFTYAQILNPGSKQELYERVVPNIYGENKYSYDQILDAINFLGSDYHKYIEVLNHFIELKCKRNLAIGYFDCTNYYFEIDEEDDLRRKGPSKENRHSLIIGQSLLLDADMIPLDMQLYPGSQSEKPYLRERIEDMKSRNSVSGRVIQIADKGLNCARNIYAAAIEAGDGYIFSKSVHGRCLSGEEKKWVLLEDDDANIWHDVRDGKNRLIFKYKDCVDTFSYACKINPDDEKETKFKVKEKRVVTYNQSLALKQRREINKTVDRLKEKIRYKEIVREELGDATKYVTLEAQTIDGEKVKIATSLNNDKIEEDLKFAGFNLLVTSEIDADAKEIYAAYHNLWQIEHSFRIMKTHLEARPVYVSTKETIYGHFLMVYYALTMIRLLEIKVFNNEISAEQIIDFIRDYKISENYDGTFINNATKSDAYITIKKKLGIAKLGNVYLSLKDVKTILETTI